MSKVANGCQGALEPPEPLESSKRRRALEWLCVALGGVGALVLGVPVVGLFLKPLVRRGFDVWRDVGPTDAFPAGATVKVTFVDPDPRPWAGLAGRSAAWVRRTSAEDLVAFGAYCTHVGCPVRWDAGAALFLCPCHGGAFSADGAVTAGPPPRPLPLHRIRIRGDRVEIRTRAIQAALGPQKSREDE